MTLPEFKTYEQQLVQNKILSLDTSYSPISISQEDLERCFLRANTHQAIFNGIEGHAIYKEKLQKIKPGTMFRSRGMNDLPGYDRYERRASKTDKDLIDLMEINFSNGGSDTLVFITEYKERLYDIKTR